MWNDKLEKETLLHQLREIKTKGMNQIIIHPRFGLETEYLSEGWFEAISWVLKEAEKQEMGIWIYDELNWPSGYAAGKVIKKNPEFQAMNLVMNNGSFEKRKSNWKPAYFDGYYIDVLNPKAVRAFIEEVYEQYWQRFNKYFGKTILGFFTDEPGIYNNFSGVDPGSIPWTEQLPSFFQKLNGYPLEEKLGLIWEENGHPTIETRIDFWKTISFLYQESYFKQLQSWCHQHGVLFIGHVLGEESLVETAKTQGDFFSAMEFLDFAGYDLLNSLTPKAIIAAKLAQSASKYFDLYGVCAETFGIFGWDLTKEQMRKVAKWQVEMGLDVLIPHALYYSLRGSRYDDCPPSLMADKYWEDFEKFVSFTRDLTSKKKGETPKPKIAIYYPIESIWGYLNPNNCSKAEFIDLVFRTASFTVYNTEFHFDYIDRNVVTKKGISYKYLILPETEILPVEVLEAISNFISNGGQVIVFGNPPKLATKEEEQSSFSRIYNNISDNFKCLPLPKNLNRISFSAKSTQEAKAFLNIHLPPIWLARAVRIAKLLGYRKTFSLRLETGMEEELKNIIY